jgi:hypothetical protein
MDSEREAEKRMRKTYDGSMYDEGLEIEYILTEKTIEFVSPIFWQLNPIVQDAIVDEIARTA